MTSTKSWIHKVLLLIGLCVSTLLTVYWFWPEHILDTYFASQRMWAGMREDSISIDGATWRYAEGGKGETVLLIHGMAGSKENWYATAHYLTSHYRVVAPDLPGFGESQNAQDDDYRISTQVERLYRFVDDMKLARFHLVGHSMGGHIAGIFAARYPDRVATLTLMNSAGVEFTPNAFQALLERGENPFASQSVEKFDAFTRMVFEHPPFMPKRLRLAYMARNSARTELWNHILQQISSENSRYYLQRELSGIQAPVLVLWCQQDQLLDVSSVATFRAGLPTAQIKILDGCGHMPMMEKPSATATALRFRFHQS